MKPFDENGGIHPQTFLGIVMHREVSHVNVFETAWSSRFADKHKGKLYDPLALAHAISVTLF